MSDFEGDIDDELLELAGATENKRKRRQGTSSKPSTSKRRKAEVSMETDSDNEPESEEDDSNLYPLEGKYIDDADRQRLMQMSEIEREDILAQRLEERQRILDKRNLDQMLKEQNSHGVDPDSVSKAAKRQHPVRGATKEKTRKLDELKARRKAKDEKKRTKTNSPKRDRSSSPMDMETSDEEEEDGQISKFEQEEEKDRKLFNKTNPEDEPITIADLEKCRLTRNMLAKYCMTPWFEDYVKGAWVRYLIGGDKDKVVYRICEITNLSADLVKPYKLDHQTVNQAFDLKHGKSVRSFNMDKVSNASFSDNEFTRLQKVCSVEDVKLPSKRALEKKIAQLTKLANQPMTEADISAMLARKHLVQSNKVSSGWVTMEKSRLTQARTLAIRRQDYSEVDLIDTEIAALTAASGGNASRARGDDISDILAKVNERNRKANIEAVRKAELIETERKRRERKLASRGAAPAAPHDPSARLRILPRTFNAATPASRPGTPQTGTPLQPPAAGTRSVSPLAPAALAEKTLGAGAKTFEASVIDSIEVDLGDF